MPDDALSLPVRQLDEVVGRVTARPGRPGRPGFVQVEDEQGRALLRGDPRALALPLPAVGGPPGLVCVVVDVLLALGTEWSRARRSSTGCLDQYLQQYLHAAGWAERARPGLVALRGADPLAGVRRTALAWDVHPPSSRARVRANTVQSVLAEAEQAARRRRVPVLDVLHARRDALVARDAQVELVEATTSAIGLVHLDASLGQPSA